VPAVHIFLYTASGTPSPSSLLQLLLLQQLAQQQSQPQFDFPLSAAPFPPFVSPSFSPSFPAFGGSPIDANTLAALQQAQVSGFSSTLLGK
jgi:hypothetical protein